MVVVVDVVVVDVVDGTCVVVVVTFVVASNFSSSTVLNKWTTDGLFIWTTVSDGFVETFASSKSPPNSSKDSNGNSSFSTRSLFVLLKLKF